MSATCPNQHPLSSLQGIIEGVREIHLRMLTASEVRGVDGTCLYASTILQQMLVKFASCDARVRGGDGLGFGGCVDCRGNIRGHYWVEGTTPDGIGFVADVTADQFGYDAIYLERVELSRQRYLPGDDTEALLAFQELLGTLLEASDRSQSSDAS